METHRYSYRCPFCETTLEELGPIVENEDFVAEQMRVVNLFEQHALENHRWRYWLKKRWGWAWRIRALA